MSTPRMLRFRGLSAFVAGRTHTLPSLPPPDLSRPVSLPDLQGASPRVIQERVSGLVAVCDIDDSISMEVTDPARARIAACHSVLNLMRRHGGGRAGVIRWGDTAPEHLALPPVPVRSSRRRLNRALNAHLDLGGTNPALALERVHDFLPGVRRNETLAVLLLTDGMELGGVQHQLEHLPVGSVHVVLVDPSGDCWGQEDAWRALPWGSFTRLDGFDRQQTAWEAGAAIAKAIGLELTATSNTTQKETSS